MEFLENVVFFSRVFWHCSSPKGHYPFVRAWQRLLVSQSQRITLVNKTSGTMAKCLVMSMVPSRNTGRLHLALKTVCILMYDFVRQPLFLDAMFLLYLSFDVLDRGVSSNDFPCLENLCKKIIKEKQPFERLEIKKETLLEMFKVSENTKTNYNVENCVSNRTLKEPPLHGSTTNLSAAFWMRRLPLRLPQCTGEYRPCACKSFIFKG